MTTDPIADMLTRVRNAIKARHSKVDIPASKLKRELGWAPTVGFDDGMARTVDWYLANGGWVGRVLDGSYRMERMGQGT